MPNKPSLRVPAKLAFTAFQVAIAGTVARSCGDVTTQHASQTDDQSDAAAPDGHSDALADVKVEDSPSDAVEDTVAMDSPADAPNDSCANAGLYCGPLVPDASCPGPVCSYDECSMDAGCTPYS
jgi:hypothetical protein